MTSLDGINGRSIHTLLRGENDSKQSDEIQATLNHVSRGKKQSRFYRGPSHTQKCVATPGRSRLTGMVFLVSIIYIPSAVAPFFSREIYTRLNCFLLLYHTYMIFQAGNVHKSASLFNLKGKKRLICKTVRFEPTTQLVQYTTLTTRPPRNCWMEMK